MNKLLKIIAICACVGALIGAALCFRDEIVAFVKNILDKVQAMRCDMYDDCCFDDSYDDFDDFDDLPKE